MEARDILIRPRITERTTDLMAEGKYVFIVDKRMGSCYYMEVLY